MDRAQALCCLMTLVSVRTFGIMYDHTFFSKLANHQIRHQATYNVGCQPGDCTMVTLIFCRGLYGYVWVDADELCSVIANDRVLDLELYTHKNKLILLHLFTDLFRKDIFLTLQNIPCTYSESEENFLTNQ